MKIAILGTKGIPATYGGIERHVEELAVRFVKMGHDVTVYCRPYYTTQTDEFYKGIRLKKLPSLPMKNFDAITHTFISTFHLLFRDYDIVHYHAIGPSTMAPFSRFTGKLTVTTVHGLDWQREKWGKKAKTYLKIGERTAVWAPHATIAVSKFLKDYLEKKYRRPIMYIPSAINEPVSLPPNKIKEYGIGDRDYVLFVARLVPEKGAHFLIEAFKKLKTDKKLIIAGGASLSEDYVEELKKQAGDNVIFTGYVYGEELQELYSNAYCYVHPSTIEGLPITLLEALAYGNCIIASDIPACVELAEDVGMVFPSQNVDELAESIQTVLDHPQMAQSMREKAKAVGMSQYSYDNIAVKTVELYQRLLDGWRPSGADMGYSGPEAPKILLPEDTGGSVKG